MRGFHTYINYLPKKLLGWVLTIVLLLVPVAISQIASATTGPIFNRFSNVYSNGEFVGSESDFLRAGPVNTSFSSTGLTNSYELCSGQADLWVYIHNGQHSIYNGENYNGTGVAKDTKVAISLPSTANYSVTSSAQISASNASSVTDTVTIKCGTQNVKLSYVMGSARGYSQQRGNFAISDAIMGSNGVLIGSLSDNGIVPGCWEYRIWVKVTVKVEPVQEPVYACNSLSAVIVDRDTRKFTATATAEHGAKVISYGFDFTNDGTIDQTVATNALSATSNEHTYAPGNYTAKVKVSFDTNNDGQADAYAYCTKSFTVDPEPVVPVYECTAVMVTKLSRTSFKFEAQKNVENATFEKWIWKVDGATQSETGSTFTLNQTTPKTYTVTAQVQTDKGTSPVTTTCTKTVVVDPEPVVPVYECKQPLTLTPNAIKIKQSTTAKATIVADGGAHLKQLSFDWGDGSDKTVTDKLEASHTYNKVGTYTVTATASFDVNGETKTATCIGKIEVGDVQGDTTKPPVLPNTGVESALAGFFGSSALGLSVRSWLESRRMLRRGALRKLDV